MRSALCSDNEQVLRSGLARPVRLTAAGSPRTRIKSEAPTQRGPGQLTLQQVEQCGRAVLLPQARLGFPLMPGERFRDRAGEVGGVTGAESLQGAGAGSAGSTSTRPSVASTRWAESTWANKTRSSSGRGSGAGRGQTLRRAVVAGRGQPAAVRAEGEVIHPAAVSQGRAEGLAGGRVPHPGGVVPAPRDHAAAVRAEPTRIWPMPCLSSGVTGSPGRRVPHPRRPLAAAGDDPAAVRAERRGRHPARRAAAVR